VGRELADRFLVSEVRAEAGPGHLEERIATPFRRHRDLDAADRLAVGPIDHGTLMPAKGADSVARAEERVIAPHDSVE
jgi:hypothetical protein